MMIQIPFEKFLYAKEVIKDKVLCTPLVALPNDKKLQILLKAENLQPSGSFKIRGATYSISQLNAKQRQQGVVAYSTGNHAQAVALAAADAGINATIVMSPGVPDFKLKATRKFGANIITVPVDERKTHAEWLSSTTGAYLIPPFDDPNVIIGQGTIGIEIMDQVTPSAVFVPLGGGGLISGIAAAIKQKNSKVKIIAVEPALEDDGFRSFHSGHLQRMQQPSQSIADAVKLPSLGNFTFPLISHYVDDVITVTEEETIEAMRLSLSTHMILEPSGALAIAGAMKYPSLQGPIICIASGGNTTLFFLSQLGLV